MLKSKNAFTLAELMITLTVCAFLAALLLPAIAYIRPDKQKVLFKKAYYVAERMVYELVNDEDFYPTTGETVGFANTVMASYLGYTYGGDSDSEARSKFCKLFARKVNTTTDDIHCDATHSTPTITTTAGGAFKEPTLITTDGIAWYLPYSKFDSGVQRIYVDVNNEAEPNCFYNASTCSRPDIFTIYLESDGKMYVDGVKEKEYLKSNNTTR